MLATCENLGFRLALEPNPADWLAEHGEAANPEETYRVFCWAAHYYASRHPEASDAQVAQAAGLLAALSTPFSAPYRVEDHRYRWAESVVMTALGCRDDARPPSARAVVDLVEDLLLRELPQPAETHTRQQTVLRQALTLLGNAANGVSLHEVAQARELLERLLV